MGRLISENPSQSKIAPFKLFDQNRTLTRALLEKGWSHVSTGPGHYVFPGEGDHLREDETVTWFVDNTNNMSFEQTKSFFRGGKATIFTKTFHSITFVAIDQMSDIGDYAVSVGPWHLVVFLPDVGKKQDSVPSTYDARVAHLFQRAFDSLGRKADVSWNGRGILQLTRTPNDFARILIHGGFDHWSMLCASPPEKLPYLTLEAIIGSADLVNFHRRPDVCLKSKDLFTDWSRRDDVGVSVEIMIDDKGEDWPNWRQWLSNHPTTDFLLDGADA
ncbi:MAG TPA: hypothetical protein VM144_11230 [Aestuariivirga sp.]|nr:hypothetical protein [Aestuariivirga sp.]